MTARAKPTHDKISGTDVVLNYQTKLLNRITKLEAALNKIIYLEQIGTRASGFDTATYKVAKKALVGRIERDTK